MLRTSVAVVLLQQCPCLRSVHGGYLQAETHKKAEQYHHHVEHLLTALGFDGGLGMNSEMKDGLWTEVVTVPL